MPESTSFDDDAEAATLAWAILQFDQAALPVVRASSAALGGEPLGKVGVSFFPTGRTVALAEVPRALRDLPKPVMLSSLAGRGHIGVWTVDSLAPDERERIQHELENQQGGLDMYCQLYALEANSLVLLDTGLDARVFAVSTFARVLRDYGLHVGWRMKALTGDTRAKAQLVLTTSGGTYSPGWRD